MPGRFRLAVTLCAGVFAVSFGSVLVKQAQEAPSLTIAFYRMASASLILFPLYWANRETGARRTDRNWGWFLLAAISLTLHFAFWISSLRYTSVAISVLLVNMSPILVATISHFLVGERLTVRGRFGIGLALFGATLLLGTDVGTGGDWRGSALALAGAVALALYLIAGGRVRRTAGLWSYVYPTYLLAALGLGVLAAFSGARFTGFSTRTWLFLLLLGLVPQSIGHTCYNWSLKHLPATVVSTLVLGEPALAPVLAWIFLGETLGPIEVCGGVLVMIGILLVSRGGLRSVSPLVAKVVA